MHKERNQWSMKKSSVLTRELVFIVIASLTIALDQVSKFLVRDNMSLGESIPEEGFFRITYLTNAGGVWGIFNNTAFLTVATTVVVIATIVLYLRYPRVKTMTVRVALGLLLGGAIGNLADRIIHGRVTDFIDVGAWPVFNLADCAIVIGIIAAALYLIFSTRKTEKTHRPRDD
jgi:signal peptidase II